jgi:hypothetical protein
MVREIINDEAVEDMETQSSIPLHKWKPGCFAAEVEYLLVPFQQVKSFILTQFQV